MLGNKGSKKFYRTGGSRGGQDQFKWDDVKSDKVLFAQLALAVDLFNIFPLFLLRIERITLGIPNTRLLAGGKRVKTFCGIQRPKKVKVSIRGKRKE